MAERRFEEIVRVADMDLDGSKPLEVAIRGIKGISFQMSKAVIITTGLDPKKKLKELSETEIKKLEDTIKNPIKAGIPKWMTNHRKEMETGQDIHIVSTDLEFSRHTDIDQMRKIRCYKGVRHSLGQPVRGQRTRSSFRTSGAVVGVSRKAIKAAKVAEAKAEAKPGAKAEAAKPAEKTEAKPTAAVSKPVAKPEAKKSEAKK